MYNSPNIKYRSSLIEENPALLVWILVLGGYLVFVLIAKYAWYISDRQIVEFTLWLVLLISLIHVWWCVSLAAGTHGNGGGVASAAILGLGWTLLTNGYPIVFCPPVCAFAAPLSDVGHVGSIVLGLVAPAAAIWALWRGRCG